MYETHPADLPQAFERRAYVRYRRALDTLWQILGRSPSDLTSCRVFDLSATGVGLVLDRAFALETTLVLRIPTATMGWMSHLVRVKRCVEIAADKYEVGCAFVRPLSAAQLQAHLS
jgi:hypothetical protein